MVTICGLSHYNVGIFHLFNHAFFKALLFLTAGAVIHALANEQDVRKFGGLQQILIFSYTALLVGTFALVGTPFLTGFYSKDVILELAYARYSLSANFSYLLTIFSVLTTSYYSFRLLFLCFHSGPNITNLHKVSAKDCHDADGVMIFVLGFLALGSIYAGWFFRPMFIGLGTDFWNNSLMTLPSSGVFIEAEFLPVSIKHIPLFGTVLGCVLAYLATVLYTKQSYHYATYLRPVYIFLNQRWHYDKLLNEALAYPGYRLGFSFVKVFDKGLLELLPMFGALPQSLKELYIRLGATQSGLIYHYAAIMIFTALCALTLLSFGDVVLFYDARLGALMCVALMVL